MADVYFPREAYELFVFIGEPLLTGGYGLRFDLRRRRGYWEVMPQSRVMEIELMIRKKGTEPNIISEDLADSITWEIENLPDKKSNSEALNKQIMRIFKELEKN